MTLSWCNISILKYFFFLWYEVILYHIIMKADRNKVLPYVNLCVVNLTFTYCSDSLWRGDSPLTRRWTRLVCAFQSDAAHTLGVCHRVYLLNRVVSWVEVIEARSCPAVNVTDSTLGGVPTRVFQPKGENRLRRGVIYFHGGGWALGSASWFDSRRIQLGL